MNDMGNSVELNDEGFIEVRVVGDQNYASVTSMGLQTKRLLEKLSAQDKPLRILDDITKLGNSDIKARKTVADLAQSLTYERIAMLGDGSVVMRVGTNLLLRAVGKGKRIKYFENRHKAIKWLLES